MELVLAYLSSTGLLTIDEVILSGECCCALQHQQISLGPQFSV